MFDSGSDSSDGIDLITGTPVQGSQSIYEDADLTDLCIDEDICEPSYDKISEAWINTEGQEALDSDRCNFDYDPNLVSSFILNQTNDNFGVDLYLSKTDLFFIAWSSLRYQINPYFLLGIMTQESYGDCAAVSSAGGEGCFQITNYYGQEQLNDSYPDRVADWNWTDRSGEYYPDEIFVDLEEYFGANPPYNQFRLTTDPSASSINGVEVSSVVNFPFGIIASSFYFRWQENLYFSFYSDLSDTIQSIIAEADGKASLQAAAYNGGAYGAISAVEDGGADFLDLMATETQDYSSYVLEYCKGYEAGEGAYNATYNQDELDEIIDLLAMTYPSDSNIDWDLVKQNIADTFFADGTTELTFVDDIKAVIYVISRTQGELGPEWPDGGSI